MADPTGFDASAERKKDKPNASNDSPDRMLTAVSLALSKYQPFTTAVLFFDLISADHRSTRSIPGIRSKTGSREVAWPFQICVT